MHVCSYVEAAEILCSPSQRSDVVFVVSIGDPEDHPPAGYSEVRERMRLLFSDTVDEETGPTVGDVERLIRAASRLAGRSGRVLVHCQAGISRSAAAAMILYAAMLGAGGEEEAVARVLRNRPIARPNRRMIEIADHLLEREGRLIAALEAAQAERGW